MKDPSKKESPHKTQTIKKYFISTIKKSTQFYFIRFFQDDIKDLKNTRKGIKKIISLNSSNHTFPTAITVNETVFNPSDVANAQLHSTKPGLSFGAGSNPARGVSEIRDGEDL